MIRHYVGLEPGVWAPKESLPMGLRGANPALRPAEALHRELIARRKDMEYRFKAFVADVPTSYARTRSLKPNK
ncbi:hypothetical protein DPMN_166610 [Dreissena polymorpha]|uniref:Uncharacterized protein n=1 Tax=Dreissena polymorpha TaxID=45954 RepID=A0A9D4IUB1_DREPO|nr:hypothetical protein DPMN_166610 [Dreissena polymorpha]